ncbi:MAG: 4-hydroxy-2-oxovalerate aldolase [Gaiellaceae bacterium]|jgi:4-hydroxy 2-oxovalerate aldolase
MSRLRIVDATLRDGSHAVSHTFSPDNVRRVCAQLDQAGIYAIEVGHGDGLAGSSIQYGRSQHSDLELVTAAAEVIEHAYLAVLLLPGIGTKEELASAHDAGATMVRVATHCTEADIAQQHIGLGREMGMKTVTFLMMAHMIPPEKLAEQAKLMESYGAEAVYVTDSAGALTMDGAQARVAALRDALDAQTEVGIHAHNNLGLAVANTVVAIEAGATFADGCLTGLGAGAGNCQTEVLVAVLDRLGYETGINLWALEDVAEETVRPLQKHPQVIDRIGLTLGYAGVYSSFLLHARRASERFGVDARDILVELGRRGVVGGQEDMIIDAAVELAGRKQSATA